MMAQVQTLERTQPLLPIASNAPEKRTHDYVRHGTTDENVNSFAGRRALFLPIPRPPQRLEIAGPEPGSR
jgi:hypothetical protein